MQDPNYSTLFHQASKDLFRGHPPIPSDDTQWPEEWKTVFHKDYSRLPEIKLDHVGGSSDLFSLIKHRRSRRDFKKNHSLAISEISSLLEYSCGFTSSILRGEDKRRAQPSGGGRFPIEVYPLVLRAAGDVSAGLYHYNVKDRSLDKLWERQFSQASVNGLFTYSWVENASVVIIMTAVFARMQNKYGERGYRHVLLEAGHIGQNIYLVAEALGLKCCALGGTKDENIEDLLDIDGTTESVVYALAIGK